MRLMTPALRKLALTTHVTSSVGGGRAICISLAPVCTDSEASLKFEDEMEPKDQQRQ